MDLANIQKQEEIERQKKRPRIIKHAIQIEISRKNEHNTNGRHRRRKVQK